MAVNSLVRKFAREVFEDIYFENIILEILSKKASAKNDVKTMLKAAEGYIVKSGLFRNESNSSGTKVNMILFK